MTERRVADDTLQQARDAISRHAWQEAFDLLTAVDVSDGLTPEDLEGLAEAAWWTGRMDECIQAGERAHAAYSEAGNNRRAAYVALGLADNYYDRLAPSVAMGWLNKAQRLLQEEPECPEQGHLAHALAGRTLGNLDSALDYAKRTYEIGSRFGDRDLQALGLNDQGRTLIAKGEVAEGMALLDEATAAAVSGELGPFATAVVYCNMISACEQLADYGRAGEWTEAAKRWCERQSISGFPGLCRVHRAQVMRLRGAWAEAEQDALRACDELERFAPAIAAEAFSELGEIRLRTGDLSGAEEAFRQAHELGTDPQPGLSLLRLAQGNTEAAASSIRRALADRPSDRLGRARLLPAQVEIALAAGDLETARSTADEMDSIAGAFGSAALQAGAACARGALALVEGDAGGALQSLRQGLRLWQEVDAPFEAARARVLLAQAYRAEGDEEAAALELEAAKSTFERLGAVPDAQGAASLLAAATGAGRTAAPTARATRTFMFTDICASTNLLEAMGDEAWEDILRWHDQTLRSLFAQHEGEEIKHAGDGFFVAFSDAAAALGCAAAIQRTLADHRRTQGFAPQVRIGLHTAEATRRGRDYGGKAVHQAARIASLAEAGEVLASEETLSAAPDGLSLSAPRTVNLKGFAKPVRVAAIEWR